MTGELSICPWSLAPESDRNLIKFEFFVSPSKFNQFHVWLLESGYPPNNRRWCPNFVLQLTQLAWISYLTVGIFRNSPKKLSWDWMYTRSFWHMLMKNSSAATKNPIDYSTVVIFWDSWPTLFVTPPQNDQWTVKTAFSTSWDEDDLILGWLSTPLDKQRTHFMDDDFEHSKSWIFETWSWMTNLQGPWNTLW